MFVTRPSPRELSEVFLKGNDGQGSVKNRTGLLAFFGQVNIENRTGFGQVIIENGT
jgi:hypothetical protein